MFLYLRKNIKNVFNIYAADPRDGVRSGRARERSACNRFSSFWPQKTLPWREQRIVTYFARGAFEDAICRHGKPAKKGKNYSQIAY